MYWSKNKSTLKHGKEYLTAWNELIYSLHCYFDKEDTNVSFTGEGFYFFHEKDNIWIRSSIQPKYWMEIYPPEN